MVLSQYPDLEKVAQEVANWDRTQGYNKMQSIMQANPEIDAVISGNDEVALGAIAALKEAGRFEGVIVGGFDGSPDVVDAVKAGEMAHTVPQPVAVFSRETVIQADHYIKNGEPMVAEEKQLFDCLLITPDNVANYTAAFTLSE
jgi:erythritol transport system substrate-binding protein